MLPRRAGGHCYVDYNTTPVLPPVRFVPPLLVVTVAVGRNSPGNIP